MLALTALRLSTLAAVRLQQPPQYTVTVGDQLGATSGAYVCWNIDASENRGFFWRNLSASSTYGAKLARQASALARGQATGHSYLRFGGSGNDFLTYAFGGTVCPPPSTYRHCLNETHWRGLLSFTAAANARIIFGLSLNTGPDLDDGQPYPFPWDPSNARQILQWTIAQRLDHLLLGFELGNEQNTRFTGDQMAHNAAILQNLTIELWPDATRRPVCCRLPPLPLLLGPAVPMAGSHGSWLPCDCRFRSGSSAPTPTASTSRTTRAPRRTWRGCRRGCAAARRAGCRLRASPTTSTSRWATAPSPTRPSST